MKPFHSIYAKSESDGKRYAKLSKREIRIHGNLKYAAQPLTCDRRHLTKLQKAIGERPVWLAASTHEGEESLLVDAHRLLQQRLPEALLIIAPRHPNRGNQIAKELSRQNLKSAQRSKNEPILPSSEIYLADTLGEMGLFYRLCQLFLLEAR